MSPFCSFVFFITKQRDSLVSKRKYLNECTNEFHNQKWISPKPARIEAMTTPLALYKRDFLKKELVLVNECDLCGIVLSPVTVDAA